MDTLKIESSTLKIDFSKAHGLTHLSINDQEILIHYQDIFITFFLKLIKNELFLHIEIPNNNPTLRFFYLNLKDITLFYSEWIYNRTIGTFQLVILNDKLTSLDSIIQSIKDEKRSSDIDNQIKQMKIGDSVYLRAYRTVERLEENLYEYNDQGLYYRTFDLENLMKFLNDEPYKTIKEWEQKFDKEGNAIYEEDSSKRKKKSSKKSKKAKEGELKPEKTKDDKSSSNIEQRISSLEQDLNKGLKLLADHTIQITEIKVETENKLPKIRDIEGKLNKMQSNLEEIASFIGKSHDDLNKLIIRVNELESSNVVSQVSENIKVESEDDYQEVLGLFDNILEIMLQTVVDFIESDPETKTEYEKALKSDCSEVLIEMIELMNETFSYEDFKATIDQQFQAATPDQIKKLKDLGITKERLIDDLFLNLQRDFMRKLVLPKVNEKCKPLIELFMKLNSRDIERKSTEFENDEEKEEYLLSNDKEQTNEEKLIKLIILQKYLKEIDIKIDNSEHEADGMAGHCEQSEIDKVYDRIEEYEKNKKELEEKLEVLGEDLENI